MRITLICCTVIIVLTGTLLANNADGQGIARQKVSITLTASPLVQAVEQLSQKTGVRFYYNEQLLKTQRIKAADFKEKQISEILQKMLPAKQLTFEVTENSIIIRGLNARERAEQARPGRISGKVLDERGGALPGASVKVVETGRSVQANANGIYTIELPPGSYTLEISYLSFATRRITLVTVNEAENTPLDIVMKQDTKGLKEVLVTADYKKASVEGLYARQKNNAAISDGISADQIRVTPDNNAAQVLKRVNGITIQDEKFVTIRGLSERYNNVVLNGANLPSTEPNRRNFSFDVIPSALIDNIVVNKTATADMPAEFAGGLVQVNTKSIPEANFFTITAGSGINTNSANKAMYGTNRGKNDYLGFDDGTRGWWNKTWDNEEYRKYLGAGDRENRSKMDQRIPNNWGIRKYAYSPVQNYQFMAGRKIDLKDKVTQIGITLGATYRHDETVTDETRYMPSYYLYDNAHSYNFNTALGAVANIGFQRGTHKIAFKNLYNRRFSNESNIYYGQNWDKGYGPIKYYIDMTLINSLWQNRLEGEHQLFGKLKFDWSADNIMLNRDQPDTRASNGFQGDIAHRLEGQYRNYTLSERLGFLSDGLTIFNSDFKERRKNAAANFTLPVQIAGTQQSLKAGYAGAFRSADNKSLGLRMLYDPAATSIDQMAKIDESVYGKSDYELHQAAFLQPNMLQYQPSGIGRQGFAGDDYTGKQQVHAAYLMTDLKLMQRLRFIGGVRMEQSRMELKGVSYARETGMPRDTLMKYGKTDWLPSFNLVYNLNANMNLRAAYSKTLARADFRERAPYIYYEFKERASYKGAMGLKDARIANMDLRYEYYPGPGEVISVSAFYKKFTDPVELIGNFNTGSIEGAFYYFNLQSSTSRGFEVDMRKSLGFIVPGSKWLKKVFVSANASWMEANVKYNTTELLRASNDVSGRNDTRLAADSRNRPLQGLSPYVLNGSIGYFGDVIGLNVAYNRFGPRILVGGAQPWEDQYENPRDVIDLQLSTSLLQKRVQLRLNISDLLQQKYIVYQNQSLIPSGDVGGQAGADPYILEGGQNNDPKGNRYNNATDYVRHSWFRGRNLSLNITYNFK